MNILIAIELWTEVSNTEDYANSKIDRIKDIKNVKDNFMYIFAMFDLDNQRKLAVKLSDETRKEIRDRMKDGGHPEQYIVF
jgi:hypothetical protein